MKKSFNEENEKIKIGDFKNENFIAENYAKKLNKLKRYNTFKLGANSTENFKKPLFTITPSTTLLNLQTNLLSSQTMKKIVDPKSTVKIYYDEIYEKEKNMIDEAKIEIDKINNKKNENENQEKFIFKRKIKREKTHSFNSVKIHECIVVGAADKNLKFHDKKYKANAEIREEENTETESKNKLDVKTNEQIEPMNARSKSCFIIHKGNYEFSNQNKAEEFEKITYNNYDNTVKEENFIDENN